MVELNLFYLIFSPLFVIFFLIFIRDTNIFFLKWFSIFSSFFIFFFSCFFYFFFDFLSSNYQFYISISWITSLNLDFIFAIDGISIFFILLSTFLIPFCILSSFDSIKFYFKEFLICLFFIEFFLLLIFTVLDILLFYISFEGILLPLYFLIGFWGSRTRRIFAAFQFFLYTIFGSIFMFISIIEIFLKVGTTNLLQLLTINFSSELEMFFWLSFFFAFSVKIPVVPFHLWLTEAHVEAPTSGSVLLAGIILKIGGYGILKFLMPMFPYYTIYFTPLVYIISFFGIIYGCFAVLRQSDIKRIIAYSSVVHMNYGTLGLFSDNIIGIEGSLFVMLSHGIVSSGLFLFIGFLYDRFGTRIIFYYGGLVQLMPIFSIFFFIFSLANIGFPGTSGFIGEFLIMLGMFFNNFFLVFFCFLGSILTSVYSFWLYNRIFFGFLSFVSLYNFYDLTKKEFFISFIFCFFVIFMGIFPNFFLNPMFLSVFKLLEFLK